MCAPRDVIGPWRKDDVPVLSARRHGGQDLAPIEHTGDVLKSPAYLVRVISSMTQDLQCARLGVHGVRERKESQRV
jgi:hypothetical protein